MVKKLLLALNMLALSTLAMAQNLQLHYDLRNTVYSDLPTNFPTLTFEMFKPDNWGSTFLFVDLNLNQNRHNVGLAYMEIARDIKLGKKFPLMAHVEFNGGVGANIDNGSGFTIENAYLAGLSYSTNLKGVNLGTYLVYKYHAFEKVSNDIQWTVTWGATLFNDRLTLSGFMDVWTENKHRMNAGFESGKKVVFLAEPQIWYNVSKSIALGTEIEISNNFYPFYTNRVYFIPTIAAKWSF